MLAVGGGKVPGTIDGDGAGPREYVDCVLKLFIAPMDIGDMNPDADSWRDAGGRFGPVTLDWGREYTEEGKLVPKQRETPGVREYPVDWKLVPGNRDAPGGRMPVG